MHPAQNPLITHFHPLYRFRLAHRTRLRLCDALFAELDQLCLSELVTLAFLEMSALEDRRTGIAELDAHRLDVVDWVEVAEVSALVDEADFQSTSRRLFALLRKAHDDRAVGVEDVVSA